MTERVRYDLVAMIVHWVTALAVIGLLIVGNLMADMPRTDPMKLVLFNLHKSFGISVLLLSLFRLGWRLTHKAPELPDSMKPLDRMAALFVHRLFYVLLILIPLLGWATVSISPRNIPTMLFGTWIWPHLPFLADLDPEVKKAYAGIVKETHAAAAYFLAFLLVLHVGAAINHTFIKKDGLIRRMLPGLAVALGALWLGQPAEAADWLADPGKSMLGFTASVSGRSFDGKFKTWTAEIAFDPANPAAGHAKVLIDMTSAATGDKQRDAALPDGDWFDVKKNPQAIFEAAHFTAKGGNAYEAAGTLTIRGSKHDVTMPFTLDIAGDEAHAKGSLDIIRTDYGVGQGEWNDGSTVALKVTIAFDLAAHKNP